MEKKKKRIKMDFCISTYFYSLLCNFYKITLKKKKKLNLIPEVQNLQGSTRNNYNFYFSSLLRDQLQMTNTKITHNLIIIIIKECQLYNSLRLLQIIQKEKEKKNRNSQNN